MTDQNSVITQQSISSEPALENQSSNSTPLPLCESDAENIPKITARILGVDGFLVNDDLPFVRVGANVTLDWNITDVNSVAIILEDPTRDVSVLHSGDPHDRADFRILETGVYYVIIYASNTVCTVSSQLSVVAQ